MGQLQVPNRHVTGIAEKEERGWHEKIFQQIMAKNFSKFNENYKTVDPRS